MTFEVLLMSTVKARQNTLAQMSMLKEWTKIYRSRQRSFQIYAVTVVVV